MGPRKKVKPNPQAEVPESLARPEAIPLPESPAASSVLESQKDSYLASVGSEQQKDNTPGPSDKSTNTPASTKSWYGGTWPRTPKAAPVTKVAKESISSVGKAISGVAQAASTKRPGTPLGQSPPLRSPSLYLTGKLGSSSRSLPISATTTKVNVSSSNLAKPPQTSRPKSLQGELHEEAKPGHPSVEEKPALKEPATALSGQTESSQIDPPASEQPPQVELINGNQTGWLSWFSKADTAPGGTLAPLPESKGSPDGKGKEPADAEGAQPPSTSINEAPIKDACQPPTVSEGNNQMTSGAGSKPPSVSGERAGSRSWLPIWGTTAVQEHKSTQPPSKLEDTTSTSTATDPVESVEPVAAKPNVAQEIRDTGASPGWTFWSRGNASSATPDGTSGKLAVAGSASESQPQNVVMESTNSPDPKSSNAKSLKRERPQSLQAADDGIKPNARATTVSGNSTVAVQLPTQPASTTISEVGSKTQNFLLPPFKGLYRTSTHPGLLEQIRSYLYVVKEPPPKYVTLVEKPAAIKKALAIGVHGYFPVPMIRAVLGQPTGTSIRFADSAANAIQKWTSAHGYACEVEKIALEGEGKIEERVELLWKLLLNWIEVIRKADFILVACHSQGVPVALMLVAKLISFGLLHGTRIGVCAMAGVNLGPFADYKSRWIGGSAGELFDFARPDSRVSKGYEEALEKVLKYGVRIVYCGSIDDQLVSLESSTFGVIEHPYVYRAVFVDGRLHAPSFLTHLVGFALKLRNLGISDHGLIRELSSPLAGSLYGGEGHSRIYDEPAVYDLAVEYALETSDLGEVPLKRNRAVAASSQNPYILPFAMRGVLEEEYVRAELLPEVNELVQEYDAWKPTSKALKDVKFRLEGVRSKL